MDCTRARLPIVSLRKLYRTTSEALADGVPFKAVWRAVWAFLELPDAER